MWTFVARRVLWAVPTLLGVTLVCFFLMHFADAEPLASRLAMTPDGRQVSSEAIEHLRSLYGLDKPWYVQYTNFVTRLVTLELGNRWLDGRPIAELVAEAMPITLLLASCSLALAYLLAVPIGVLSAVRKDSLADRILTTALFVLYSLPSFWVGTMALVFLASGHYVDCGFTDQPGCFPLRGVHAFSGFEQLGLWERVGDVAFHLVLPVATLTYNGLAALSRHTRSAMIEALRTDYVRAARARGLPERVVVFGHALRNSCIPLLTLFGLNLPRLISGSVVVESIFGIRGMGLLTLEAIRLPDYPLVITNVALTGFATVAGVLLSDILVGLADPRIRTGHEASP